MVFVKGFSLLSIAYVYFLSYGSLFTCYSQILYQHQFTLFLLPYTGSLPTTHFENDTNLIVIKCYWFRLLSKGLPSMPTFYDQENLSVICTRLIKLWRFQKGTFPYNNKELYLSLTIKLKGKKLKTLHTILGNCYAVLIRQVALC